MGVVSELIKVKCYCPICGNKIQANFSTKDQLDTYTHYHHSIHAYCKSCKHDFPYIINEHMKVEEYTDGG